jgi:hypothetical protein
VKRLALIISAVVLLAGCGGSGGRSDGPPYKYTEDQCLSIAEALNKSFPNWSQDDFNSAVLECESKEWPVPGPH